jgi:hypothetical protein
VRRLRANACDEFMKISELKQDWRGRNREREKLPFSTNFQKSTTAIPMVSIQAHVDRNPMGVIEVTGSVVVVANAMHCGTIACKNLPLLLPIRYFFPTITVPKVPNQG